MGSKSCEGGRIVVSWELLVRSNDGNPAVRECGGRSIPLSSFDIRRLFT
jgi:hypothetical protein